MYLFFLLVWWRLCLPPTTTTTTIAGLLLFSPSRWLAGPRLVTLGNDRGRGHLGDVELSLILTADELLHTTETRGQ